MSSNVPFGAVAFIGTGKLGGVMARALDARGVRVSMVANRSDAKAQALARSLTDCRVVPPHDAAQADLVFITTPDDLIGPTAAALPWRMGQAVVHCSGATEVSVLQPALQAGAEIGGFHPLMIFSDPERALSLLQGSCAAIEGPPALEARLLALAQVLGMNPLRLPAGARALYHGGGSFAASFLLSMLKETVDAWAAFGMSEQQTLQALMPMAHGALDAALTKGLSAAVAGPVSRGDAGVVARHIAAFEKLGPEHLAFYREMTRRQVELVQETLRLSAEQAQRIRDLLSRGPDMSLG